jgi:hypothetical protein
MTSNSLTQDCFSPKKSLIKDCFKPVTFTTHRKQHNTKTESLEKTNLRTAKSSLSSLESELGLNGLFEGGHNHLNFDCPKPLVLAFKTATKANGTSVCKELQKYALSYVVSYSIEKTAFGNTLSKVLKPKLTIQNLNFEQYCQSRPRRLIRRVEAETVTGEGELTCQVSGCLNGAVGVGVHVDSGKKYRLCALHLEAYADSPKLWRVV